VYEPLESKWGRYHATHCKCGQDWLTAHAIPAGFTVLPRGTTGYYGLVGPGLTEGADGQRAVGGGHRQARHPDLAGGRAGHLPKSRGGGGAQAG
jgi:hypothetical protein